MATEKDHLKRAMHNEKFLRTISDEFSDWLAVVTFYVAVHLVEAFFAKHKHHSRGHRERNEHLKLEYEDIYRQFYPLYTYSLFARYDCMKADVRHIREELIGKRLPALKSLLEQQE